MMQPVKEINPENVTIIIVQAIYGLTGNKLQQF